MPGAPKKRAKRIAAGLPVADRDCHGVWVERPVSYGGTVLPDFQRRLLVLATKAGIKGRKPRLHGRPHLHRLIDFVTSLQQRHFTRGSRYVSVATEPLYAWSAHFGLPIWHWVGKGFAEPGDRLHPRCRQAFKQVLDQVVRWRRGEDVENMPCSHERLMEYVECNFQCAGFFSKVLDIVDELGDTRCHGKGN